MRGVTLLLATLLLFTSIVFGQQKITEYDHYNPTQEQIEDLRTARHEFYTAKSAGKDAAIKREILNSALKLDGNQADFDVKYYGIHVDLNFSTGQIDNGQVDFIIESVVSGLNSVDINLRDELTVDGVSVNGFAASYSHLNDMIVVTLPTTMSLGEQFDMEINYHGTPVYISQQGMSFDNVWGQTMCWTNCEPYGSRYWWPCKDYPLDKPDSIDLYIEYPSTYRTLTNGVIISDTDIGGGRKLVHYKHMYPIATYLVAISCANFNFYAEDTWNYNAISMPIYSYGTWDSYNAYRNEGPVALTNLSDFWGLYPYADEKMANGNYGWGGAMEHQSCAMYNPGFYTDWVIAHESGHQWWGDMITCKTFHHIWLNEGFASYSEAVDYEARYGMAAYHAYMQSQKYTGGGTIIVENLLTDNIFDNNLVYDKGSWVVHMLRGLLGDTDFHQVITAYYDSEFKYNSATTQDFASVISDSYGSDLNWFVNQWIYNDGSPNYQISWICEPNVGGGYDLNYFIEQAQGSGDYFKMPIQHTFVTTGGNIDTTIWNELPGEAYALWFPDSVTNILFDVDEWILRTVNVVPYSFHISTRVLPDGYLSEPYFQQLMAVGGDEPYSWTFLGGDLPFGMTFNGGTVGTIDGTPSWKATYFFTLEAEDSDVPPSSEIWNFSITVTDPVSNFVYGDADGSGEIDISDAVFVINYIFGGGPAPEFLGQGDADCSGAIDISDAVYLISYIFAGGPIPDCS